MENRTRWLETLCKRCLSWFDDDPEISDASFERLDQLVDDLREALDILPTIIEVALPEDIRERLDTIEKVYAKVVGRSHIGEQDGEADIVRTAAFLMGYIAALEDVQGKLDGEPWKGMAELKQAIAQMKQST